MPNHSWKSLPGLVLLLCLTQTGEGIQAAETVTVQTMDRLESRTADLIEWSEDKIVVSDEAAHSIPLDDLLSLTFERRPIAPAADDSLVILSNGDRLVLRVASLADDELKAHWQKAPARPSVTLPLEMVTAIVFSVPAAADDRHRLFAALQTLPTGQDVLLLVNGDRVQGELELVDGAFVQVKTGTGALKLDRSRVQAIRLNPELTATIRMPGRRLAVALQDGSRFSASRIELVEGNLRCQTFTRQEFTIGASEFASCQVYGARAIPLADRDPASVTFVPYLSQQWPMIKNANVLRSPLSLRGTEFGTGLGVHSRCLLTYDIQPGDHEFRSIVGVDDAAQGAGSVQFSIEVDGRRVWQSTELTGRSPALATVPVPLQGVKKLTLIVDFGSNTDISDYADWCDALILRQSPE